MSERVHGERSHRDGHKKDFDLRTRIEQVMKGFHGVNAIAYRHKNEYVTYSRPSDIIKVSADDEFAPDRKDIWPVLSDMHTNLPYARIKRRSNRVDDPTWTVTPSDKTPIIPEPVFPQSKGLKLRPIDEIINDKKFLGKMAPPEATSTPPPHSTTSSTNSSKKAARPSSSSSSSSNAKSKAFDAPSSKIQGVLDIITESSRKPVTPYKSTTPPIKSSRSKEVVNVPVKSSSTLSTPTANRPRKSSLLKSEIKDNETVKPRVGSKKPMSSLTNDNHNNGTRPRVSSKSTLSQKGGKYNQDIPDLIEARNYLVGELDEVEFRKLDHLREENHNTRGIPRPVLLLHFKIPSPALAKIAKKKSLPVPGKTIIKHEEIKQKEKPIVNKKIKVTENTASPTKIKSTPTPPLPPPPKEQQTPPPQTTTNTTTTTTTSTTTTKKSSLSDRSTPTTTTTTTTDKQAYPSSIPAAFLRSMKIPKRKTSEVELEEGETISPSPSPLHSSTITPTPPPIAPTPVAASIKSDSKRSRNEEVEDVVTPVSIAATPVITASNDTPPPSTNGNSNNNSSSSSSRRHSSRRDEERSSSSRRNDRHEERRSTTSSSKSHRSSHYRSRSRSRSRSPSRRSSSRRSSSRRRQTSSDSTRRRPHSSDKRKSTDSKYEESNKRQRTSEKESSRDRDKESTKDAIRDKDVSSSRDRDSVRESREKDASSSREKDSKYTTSSSSSKKPSPASSSTSTVTEKTLSATAPNAETPEQFKIFSFMFNKLALANKRRGDTQSNPIFGIIDHFHAFCDYILYFYYVDRLNVNNFKQASAAWKSIFPFTDSLLKKLESRKELELHGLCIRLNSLIRFYMYSRMEASTRPVLQQQINNTSERMTDRACVELSENLLHEFEKAERAYKDSERHMSFSTLVSHYPETFKNVCMEGNLLAGITLGGEAGVSVGPMFPFVPYAPLHHAAIVSKCILSEYVSKNNLKYMPISKPEEFM